VFWCLRWRDLFAPALHLAGLHPDRVIHVEAGSDANVLLAMEECLRHPVSPVWSARSPNIRPRPRSGSSFAAEESGVRPSCSAAAPASASERSKGTAAVTRWRIAAAPSEALGIPSLGRPRWRVALERVRGGDPKSWIVEGCDAQGRIALPAALVDRPAAAEDRQVAA
jgi:protein ImuA